MHHLPVQSALPSLRGFFQLEPVWLAASFPACSTARFSANDNFIHHKNQRSASARPFCFQLDGTGPASPALPFLLPGADGSSTANMPEAIAAILSSFVDCESRAADEMCIRDRIDEAIKVAERNKKSHLAKVVTAGLMEFKAHQDSPGEIPGETIEASKRALERTEAIVHAELKRGLGGLATIGSTAPFVGLFGTVVGILNAFNGIAKEKATGLAAVAGGISEALVTTAVGLFVAIPAVMMFNYLTGRVEAFDVEMDNSSSELIDYFLKRRSMRRS